MSAGERSTDADVARLKWRCRRGMRELDAVLLTFVNDSFDTLTDADKARFAGLLSLPDPDLYGYLVRRHEPADPELARLVERLRGSIRPPA